MNSIVLSLGSNIGKDDLVLAKNLEKAIALLAKKISLIKKSSFYKSSPVDYLDQDNFLNMVLLAKTLCSPSELLAFIQVIEKKMKSKKLFFKGPRIIDIDIIFFNDLVISKKKLTIPHPSFHQRLFVLLPLLELDPDFIDPTNKKKIKNYIQKEFYQEQKIKQLKSY